MQLCTLFFHLTALGAWALADGSNTSTSPFLNSKSKQFAVSGSLPYVDFNVGDSYAGLLPISDDDDETRKLFFWFFPCINETAAQGEITVYLDGGPGTASTSTMLVQNGPFLNQLGTVYPYPNSFAWNNVTNVVWVDQPVGTGFSVGQPNATNEYDVADQFMGFFKNFVDTFAMQGYKVYFAGESYSGYYIPYIANGFLEANDTNYYNLKGAMLNDPVIGNKVVQGQTIATQYLNTWQQVFGFNSTMIDYFNNQNQACGYAHYVDKYLTFPPPPTPFPAPFGPANHGTNVNGACYLQKEIIAMATELNPCFNVFHVTDTCPFLFDPLRGTPGYHPPGPPLWYNRPEVQKAIHAPNKTWLLDTEGVFVGQNYSWVPAAGDDSLPPADIGFISKLIEATNNFIVGVGGRDFVLPANGTLLVMQNVTWNGGQGFSSYPNQTLYVPRYVSSGADGQLTGYGDLGSWVSERGATFYLSRLAGHQDAWYTPGVAYRVLQTLLGRIPNLSSTDGF